MAFNFKTKSRPEVICAHQNTVTLEVAGLSRSVCESCGKVSVGYVSDAYAELWGIDMDMELESSSEEE